MNMHSNKWISRTFLIAGSLAALLFFVHMDGQATTRSHQCNKSTCPLLKAMQAEQARLKQQLKLLQKGQQLVRWELSLLRREYGLARPKKAPLAHAPKKPTAVQCARHCKQGPGESLKQKMAKYTVPIGNAPTSGPKDAKVTIVEFIDFQCPFCVRGARTVQQLKKQYGTKLRIAFKHMPLPFHKQAHIAAQASLAAKAQGKFWPYQQKLLANYRNITKANLLKWAKEIGLDANAFQQALDKGTYKAQVDADIAQAKKLGVRGTPTFFVNGRKVIGAQPPSAFHKLIKAQLN